MGKWSKQLKTPKVRVASTVRTSFFSNNYSEKIGRMKIKKKTESVN